ncbi:hypothetical protein DL93DRAFT_2081677 [Clavulina sp. PMI_390]|nr:hypothetical protein DL93DRAFT_2081677 [Clavulina sp. PMI_390]
MLRHQRSKKCINGRQKYNPSEPLSSPSSSPSPSLSPSSSLPPAPSAPSLVAPLAAPSRSSSEAPSLYAPTIVSPSLSSSTPLPDSSTSLSPQVSPSPIDIDGDWPTPSTTSYSPLLPTPTTPRRTMPSHPSLFDPVVSDNIATTSNDFAAYAASRSLSLDMYSLPQLSSGWRDEPVSALGLEGLHFPTGVQDYTQHSTPSAGYLSLDASNAPGLVKWTLSEDIAEILASRGA